MAIQIINDPYRTFGGGLGQALGTGLGGGLSKGLSALAQAKLKQLENAPFAQLLTQLQGGQVTPSGETGTQPQSPEKISQISKTLNPQQALQVATLNLQRQKAEEDRNLKKEIAARAENKPYIDALKSSYNKSRSQIPTNKSIIKMAESGNLRDPRLFKLLDKIGLGEWWASPDTQLTGSLLDNLVTGAGNAFNTKRLTNLEVDLYKRTLGDLSKTPEVISALAKNRLLEADADEAKYDAYRKIKSKFGDKIPFGVDIDELVEDEVAPKLALLARQAMENLQVAAAGQFNIDLPDVKEYKQGEIIEHPVLGTAYKRVGNEWEPTEE